MKGTLNIVTEGGRKASIEVDVVENKGVNGYEIEAKEITLKEHLRLYQFHTPHVVFLQLPSKMNEPGFQVEEDKYEDPY